MLLAGFCVTLSLVDVAQPVERLAVAKNVASSNLVVHPDRWLYRGKIGET